jgi:hypothetical protein
MPSWLINTGVQGTISRLPYRNSLNRFLQKRVTGNDVLSDSDILRILVKASTHLENLESARSSTPGSLSVVEIGTGSHPMVPLALYVLGVPSIVSVDRGKLVTSKSLMQAVESIVRLHEDGRWGDGEQADQVNRITAIKEKSSTIFTKPVVEWLSKIGIQYHIGDISTLKLVIESDIAFITNDVLEHMSGPNIRSLFTQIRSIGNHTIVMSHFVNMSDHYSMFDKSITPINFYKYSNKIWWIFNNYLHYQNRLRLSDYIQLHNDSEFEILDTTHSKLPRDILSNAKVSKAFARYSEEDLLSTDCWIVSRAT